MKMMRVIILGIFSLLWVYELAATALYVPNFSSNDVSVIDAATNTVIATIPVGNGPFTLKSSLDASKVYVANINANTVSVIDAATNTVTTTLTVGAGPEFFAITPDGSKLYVSNSGTNTVSVIDVATDTVLYSVTVGTSPLNLQVSPDGQSIIVPNSSDGNVSVIDIATDTVTTPLPAWSLGVNPQFLAFSPNGQTMYVASVQTAPNVYFVNLSTWAVSGPFNTVANPTQIVVSLDGSKLYCPCIGAVTVLNASTGALITTLFTPVGSINELLDMTPDGTKIFVPMDASLNQFGVINTATDTITFHSLGGGSGAQGVAISPDGRFVYFANTTTGDVTVVDVNTLGVIDLIPVGTGPRFIDFAAILAMGNISVWADGCGKDSFLSQVDLYTTIRWSYPQWAVLFLSTPTEYLIYRDNVLVGTVRADKPLIFEDHNRKPNRVHNYTVVAKDDSGFVAIGTATIKTCKE